MELAYDMYFQVKKTCERKLAFLVNGHKLFRIESIFISLFLLLNTQIQRVDM